jgi:transposase
VAGQHRTRLGRARRWSNGLPAYAPNLNPVEELWSSLKAVELGNPTGPTLAEVIAQAHQGIERLRRTM